MKGDKGSRVKRFDVDVQNIKALSNRSLSLHTSAKIDRQATNSIKWQAGGIGQTIGMYAVCEAMPHTPPPGRYIYI